MTKIKKITCILLCISVLAVNATVLLKTEASAADKSWAGTWSSSPVNAGYQLNGKVYCDFLINSSVRTVLRTSTGGEKIRLKFSNRYGASDLNIESVKVARTASMSDTAIIDGTSLPVTFGGSQSVTVPKGKTIYSDEVNMSVESFEKLSITAFYKSFTYMTTSGLINSLSYVDFGDKTDAKTFSSNAPLSVSSGSITYNTTPFLCGVDAYGKGNNCIVLFGDSTLANDSPYYLAEKLYLGGEKNTGVLQESIIGNHLLYSIPNASNLSALYGDAAIDRFKEDVLDQAGVKAVFVKLGLNDFLHANTKSLMDSVPKVTIDDMIHGYDKLIKAAHAKGIKIYFFGRQAWKGYERSFYGSNDNDLIWSQKIDDNFISLNKWLQYSSGADGYISVDSLRDTSDINKIYPPYTTDGVHLTPLGARVITDLIPNVFLSGNKQLPSITTYYNNGNKDIQNFTDKSKYTVLTTPATKAPAAQQNASATKTPGTTSVVVTGKPGEAPTEIFLVEMPTPETTVNNVIAPTAEMSYSAPDIPQAPQETMSTTTKVGIILFTILSTAMISFVIIYAVNKKKSID